jgi:hypothetical protein
VHGPLTAKDDEGPAGTGGAFAFLGLR